MNPTTSPHDPSVVHTLHPYDGSRTFLTPKAATGIKLMSDALSFAKEKGLGVFHNSQSIIADNGEVHWRAAIGLTFPYVCPELGDQPAAEYHYSDQFHSSLEVAESFLLDRLYQSATFVRVLDGIGQGVLCEFFVATLTKEKEEATSRGWAFLKRHATVLALFVLLRSQKVTEGWKDRVSEEVRKAGTQAYEVCQWYCNTATEEEKTARWEGVSLFLTEVVKDPKEFVLSNSQDCLEYLMGVVVNQGDIAVMLISLMKDVKSIVANSQALHAALT